ncbi:hypothetical protein Aph02nite_63600 [Actinoplanes philippinensis]|nr:hypothetical protein [Actinoplanes philippinensis]GIE80410.1 hypothetical protein Aph02nite_63600 [Actinoplanes philippinensis]
MSFSSRPAAGLATVGATVLAALALGGAPAMATDVVQKAGHAILTPSPDPADQRGNPGYGGTVQQVPGTPGVTTAPAVASTTPAPAGTVRTITTAPTTPARGHSGYASTPPTTPPAMSPSPSVSESLPTGTVKSSPGTGLQSANAQPRPSASAANQGVSVGRNLPVTGAPLTGTLTVGGMLVAGGATALWYTRRRRSA